MNDPMISRSVPTWQRRLAEAVTDAGELLALLGLPETALGGTAEARRAMAAFPLKVPRGFVARMRPGDARDPLLLQVLPLGAEMEPRPGFGPDPLEEAEALAGPGLLHKYQGRALLLVTGACAVHCRYCFRRHFPYGDAGAGRKDWSAALAYLTADRAIEEVILSGGDPLAASDERLAELEAALAALPHLRRLRLHTRLPVVLPERVDEGLLGWFAASRFEKVVVLHANHAREIDAEVAAAARRLAAAGATVLNQAVLLAGVNDTVEDQVELSRALFAAGVLPYYLHLLDRVAGAAHFEVPEAAARALATELALRLPGYLTPRLVREVAGAGAKVPLDLEAALLEPAFAAC